jgi:hypothetical protein
MPMRERQHWSRCDAEIRASGVTSMCGIAMALNERDIPTPAGRKTWQTVQARRLLARL